MKRSLYLSLLAAALLLVSCTDPLESVLGIDIRVSNVTLTATTELPMTKTTVVSGTLVYWEPGDAIAVFSPDTSGKFVADLTASAATATFRGRLAGWKGEGTLWGVYPYSEEASFDGESITTVLPTTQTARAESFGKDMNLAIARSDTENLQFYNVGGGVCFSVTEAGIKKVIFEGLNGEVIAGKVKVGFDDSGLPVVREVTEGSTFITLTPPEGQTFQKDTWYYLVAIPGALDKGYKMRFYKTDDFAKRVSEKAVTIKRSIYGDIEHADAGLEYEPIPTPYPKTVQEWKESDEVTMDIYASVSPMIEHYTPGDAQSVEQIVHAVSGLENVASVVASQDGTQLLIKQHNGVHVNVILGIQDEPEEGATSSAAPAPSETPATKATPPAKAAKPAATAKGKAKATSTDKQVLLLSPFQNDYPKIGPVIDTDYLSAALAGIGYELVCPSSIKLEYFIGDYLCQYPLVLIASHGAARFTIMDGSMVTSVVNTGIEVGTLDDGVDRSDLAMAICDGKAQYFITVPWLEATTSEADAFSGTMVYFGSCQSYKDNDFASFFSAQHAGYLGHSKIMAVQFDNLVVHSLVSSLAMGMNFTHSIECISKDPWVDAERAKLTSVIHWLFDYTSADSFPSSFSWKVDPSKLRKVDANYHLIDSRPINLKHPLHGNKANLSWEMPHENGEFKFKVHMNGMVYDASIYPGYTTEPLLPGNYTWYVEASLIYEGEVIETFRSKEDRFSVGGGSVSPSEAIDLGLSVKWASANIGATSSSDPGYYFAWGETSEKSDYSWSSYKWQQDDGGINKYNGTDNLAILLSEDDAAHTTLGGNWRMPTMGEWEELRNNCDWNEVKDDDVLIGYNIFSRVNDNYIFLPVTGYKNETGLCDENRPRYWSSSITNGDDRRRARNLNESCYQSTYRYYGDDRRLGMPVRAVYDDSSEKEPVTSGEYVDMGLSVRWASANLGALNIEDIGEYYAWGETYTKDSFTWNNYTLSQHPDGDQMIKYNRDDNLTILLSEDDAVHSALGGNHRMPTKGEWEELWNNSTSKLISINGRWGYLLTSNVNQNRIFLPLSGLIDGEQLRDGMRPRYWSSSHTNGDGLGKARNLNESCYQSTYRYYGDDRRLGMPIRGVYDYKAEQIELTPGTFIDMGLSVEWASSNIGAANPESIGYYFAWGELKSKTEFSWSTYKWKSNESFTKYNGADGLKILDLEDDLVYYRYGSNHRMPTRAEWEELWNNCTSEQVVINGRRGLLLTSDKNQNKIFLPFSGIIDEKQLRDGMRPRYWSSTHTNGDNLGKARNLNESCYQSTYRYYGDDRRLGMPVRAVKAKYEVDVTPGEMVDLGLSVNWASYNMGATSPEMTGNYYAWGETSAKNNYTWDNYSLSQHPSGNGMTKYNSDDGLRLLDWNDDVVHSEKGGSWRMPSKAEWEELQNNCDWIETTLYSVRGYRIVSRKNSNSIFLPCSGLMDEGQLRDGMRPRYWSSTHTNGDNLGKARNLNESCYQSTYRYYGDDRRLGMPIRGVYDYKAEQLSLTAGSFVDMGLSVDWASANMGATSPEMTGNYYAWGELQPKDNYSWSNYRWWTEDELTKYNDNDNLKVLHRGDDVVFAKYKSNHRIPTKAEWEELWNNCTATFYIINGRQGYLLTSKINQNTIFLPIAGIMDEKQLRDGMRARYWSSTHTNGNNLGKARNLNESCYQSTYRYYGDERRLGMPVRGILAKYETEVTQGEMIDLGLSVKWARTNIGASLPEDTGLYYAWGENADKERFIWDNYSHSEHPEGNGMTKYDGNDGRRVLDWNDDVVHTEKGGSWRMPSKAEWEELQSKCDWTETTLNGIRGFRIVSRTNSNSIFLPIAGFMDDTQLRDGMRPRYWSSTHTNGDNLGKARNLNESCYQSTYRYYGDERRLGMPVRGVYDDSVDRVLTTGDIIDMGLSVNWASSNIGTKNPENKGLYFGWGEVSSHSVFSWENYTFNENGSSPVMSKYNSQDQFKVLEEDDDAAYHYSNGILRMPTIGEWQELMQNTTQEVKIKNGHIGYLLTSKINGNSIFLPFAGLMDVSQFRDGMRPRYWSSTHTNGDNLNKARNLNESCYQSTYRYYGDERRLGMPVRGVTQGSGTAGVAVTGVSLNETELNLSIGGTARLSAIVSPEDATNPSVTWSSNRESVATVSADGLVTGVSEGTATITVTTVAGAFTANCTVTVSNTGVHVTGVTLDKSTMSLSVGCGGLLIPMVSPADAANDTITWQSSNPNAVRVSSGGRVFATGPGVSAITATTVDGHFSATCQVSVENNKPFESKDLGLSVQWATFNVGASSETDYGEYFAWAETEPKDSYSWENYKWGNGFTGNLTKYVSSSTDKLSNEDDVVQVYWGDGWRMPTMSEQQELMDECDWVWTREGLVYGYRVTSRKLGYTDQSIFLPASGYMEGEELQDPMSAGRYWASTLFYTQTAQAYLINFSSSGKNWSVKNRSAGFTVRPVCKSTTVTGVSLNETELVLNVGSTTQLEATVLPFNAGNKSVTWKSTPESVATVSSDGLVTAVSVGTATITVTTAEGGFSATCSVTVNPYESSDYSVDGIVHTIQTATSGSGINIVLMGDAFSDRLIADGTYERIMKKAADGFFIEEPFHSFRHLFNVYYVDVVSKNELFDGETALGTSYGEGTRVNGNHDMVVSYALNVLTPAQRNKSVIIVLMNRDYFAGTCYYWDDGSNEGDYGIGTAIAYFPTNSDTEDFNVLVSHEAGGHGFGKLADEYCSTGNEQKTVPQDKIDYTKEVESYGWRKNVDFTSDKETVKWKSFITDERYKNEGIDMYEGGLTYGKGIWHPSLHSIMNDNTGGFNAPSRYAIWYRIHKQAYGADWQGTYEDFVQYDKVNRTATAQARRAQQIERSVKHPLPHLAPPVFITNEKEAKKKSNRFSSGKE